MIGSAHEKLVYGRRIRVLAHHLAKLLPRDAHVLDVGSGDGLLARRIMDERPDLRIDGADVLARPTSYIAVRIFDGVTLPFRDRSFDAVMLVDVVHHAAKQRALLAEATRVSKGTVVIKDHLVRGFLARPTLRFMDWVGNARHGVSLPYAYWTPYEWDMVWAQVGLRPKHVYHHLHLYPWPARLLFDRELHFIAKLERTAPDARTY